MQKNTDLWYRLGYAVETARTRLPVAVGAGAEQRKEILSDAADRVLGNPTSRVLDAFLAVGAGTALKRLLALWPGKGRPGAFRVVRAAAAGAAAAFLTELLRPLVAGEKSEMALEDVLTDILLAGVGRGILYAWIVEPRVPGPALVQGSAYGALEYALAPWGGLEEIAGSAVPYRKVPALSTLLKTRDREEELLVEHLAFGVALALLYDT